MASIRTLLKRMAIAAVILVAAIALLNSDFVVGWMRYFIYRAHNNLFLLLNSSFEIILIFIGIIFLYRWAFPKGKKK